MAPSKNGENLDAIARIRDLNDAFRTAGPGLGNWLLTTGAQALGAVAISDAVAAVMAFEKFTPDNDPHGEHDFGSFKLRGETVYWKIDYYDGDLLYGSTDPSDAVITRRIMTILLASEY